MLRSKEFALKFASSTHRMLKEAVGEQALSKAKRFKGGRESVDDRKHSGRSSACTTREMIAKVREVILEDRISEMFVIALDCHRVMSTHSNG
jgi:hypothetical protein